MARTALALIALAVAGCGSGSPATTSPPTSPALTGEAAEFSGEDERASGPFDLAAGDYRVDWQATATGHGCPVGIRLEPINGAEVAPVIAEIVPVAETKTGSEIWDLDGGRYAWSVLAPGCSWVVRLAAVS